MMRQIAGPFAQFEKSRLVTKLRGARERIRVSYVIARTSPQTALRGLIAHGIETARAWIIFKGQPLVARSTEWFSPA
jgi:hypothetical protein